MWPGFADAVDRLESRASCARIGRGRAEIYLSIIYFFVYLLFISLLLFIVYLLIIYLFIVYLRNECALSLTLNTGLDLIVSESP